MINIGAQQICFQYESEVHVDRLLNQIKKAGIKAGVALVPSTPISVLEYVIELCDYVMLMLVNPGFAGDQNEKQVSYALKKINDCHRFLENRGCTIPIEVDGRISTHSIPDLIHAGSEILVLGSTSLFAGNSQPADNWKQIKLAVISGIERRMSNEIPG
jgi:ribulose-phosphate 3-epimerase